MNFVKLYHTSLSLFFGVTSVFLFAPFFFAFHGSNVWRGLDVCRGIRGLPAHSSLQTTFCVHFMSGVPFLVWIFGPDLADQLLLRQWVCELDRLRRDPPGLQ